MTRRGAGARRRAGPVLAAALLTAALPAAAQVDTTVTPVDSVIVTPEAPVTVGRTPAGPPPLPITPRSAFIRSMILPGWGQSAFDSYFRGGVFFAGWAANWFMNVRNHVRLASARDRLELRREQVARIVLDTAGLSRPAPLGEMIDRAVAADSLAAELDRLVDAREQQREDWIAWTIFWILASGVDGYVTAHLYDFPAPIDVQPNGDGSVSLGVQVPFPARRP